MKTKISHLGRSTVSVILAVMMLLSTMLVGTMSTVNAAIDLKGTYYFDNTDANWDNVYMVFIGTNGAYKEYHKMSVSEGKYYVYDQGASWSAKGFYFTNSSNGSSDGTNNTDTFSKKPDSSKNCFVPTSSSGAGSWMSLDDAKASHQSPVADSVTLTANPTSVKAGKPVTLTPTVSGEKSNNLTYTYKKISGGTATEEKNADNSLSVTPSEAGTYKYTVTVSAEGFSSVTSTEVSFTVTAPVDYYLAGRIKHDGTDGWVQSINNNYKFTESDTEGLYYYESKYTPKQWSEKVGSKNLEQYFYIIDSSSNKYGSKDNQTDNTPKVLNSTDDKSTLEIISSTDNTKTLTYISNQENVSNVTFWLDTRNGNMQLYYKSATAYSVTFGSNDISMGSVTAKNGSSNISSGDGVAENSELTFTATANEGYKFDGWYSDANCTTAITGATDTTYTTTVTANTTVYAKFVAETYNITVKENANCTVTVNQTAAYGSNVNVTVKAKDGYTVSSISVTNVNANDITGNETEGYTFKMPASNVEITPNVVAVEVTAPKVTLNTVTGESTADVSVKENYPITAFAEAGDAYSKITSTDFSVSGGVEGTDYTKTETFEGSGIYNFVALTKGTFTVTYTATATSINDITKSTSATATLKITASYTDTQNAYLALSKYVDEVKDTTSDGYTTDSYAAFSAALTSAQALLTGLPAADAPNASAYANAKTALETAFNGLEKDVTYYIGGRFKGESWNPNRTDMQFVKVDGESNLYKYETNMTVSQLSQNVDKAKQYFFIHTGNGNEKVYYASSDGLGHTFHKNSINNQLTLKYYPTKADDEKNYIKFDDVADSSSNVVMYLDTSDKDNFKLYYSADIEPDYRITGNLSAIGGWNGYDKALKFDTAESDGSYSKIITVTNEDVNSKYFKLIDKNEKYYGPNDSTYDIISSNSSLTAYDTFEGSGEGNDFYFSKAGTYKIHYIVKTGKNTPSVWVEENTTKYNVTVAENIKSIASVDKTEAAKGEKVTVTATPETGKVLDTVTVVGENDSTQIETTVSGNTATFIMPDQDVTVKKVTFRKAKTCTVTFNSNDPTFGTVSSTNGATPISSSPATVTEGDEVTFTAKPNSGYALSGWTVNGTLETRTDPSLSLKITADTTVIANFKVEDSGTPSDYYILWGTDASFSKYKAKQLYSKDGKYYANFDAATDKIGTKENCYFVFSTSNTTNGVTAEETNVTVNKVAQNNFYFESNNCDISGVGNTRVPKIWNENADLLGFKIIVSDIDSSNKKVTYSCEPTFDVAPADTVEITAKDGTIRAGYTETDAGKTTAVLGDTTLSITTPDDKIITASDSQKIDGKNRAVTAKKVPYGSTVTVTTTIDPDATFAGHNGSDYYVKGFSVNGIFGGVLSQTDGKNHTSYEYTYTFEVNQEIYGSKLEITPVYFLKNDDNCVYFYIENYDSAKQIWGNTPSCYVYYGSGTTTLEALGYYPGQPMVDYNGSIFTQIPKSIDNGGTRVDITGMTLNNYVWDDVHKDYNGKNQKEDNAQTYDYDDFVKIAESSVAPDNIIYRFKYNEFKNEPKATLEASKADPNGWEVFLDYQNYPTDIFGNRIGNDKLDYKDTDSVTNKDNYLSIISDGYQNNYIGKYATAWSIYNKAGDRVATIPSSALLYALGKSDEQMTTAIGSKSTPTDFLPGKKDRDTYWKTFKTLYNDYKGFYAQINFEAAITGGGEKGNRLDGRWYYTQSKQEITGEIKIQYANTLDDYKVGNFHDDTFADDEPSSIEGMTTGASAYFTDPKDKVRKLVTEADNTQDYKFIVNATSTATYTFVGWYRLIDGDYKAINPSDMSSLTGAVTRNSDVTLVARYIKTPGGTMTFHHSLYNGENAGGGKATTEIQVVVKNSKGEPLYDSGRIAGTASIDKTKITELATQTGLTVTVTLYTTTKNLYNFKGYYSAENTTVTKPFTTGFTTEVSGDRKEGLVTKSEYTFSFNDYYTIHKDTLIDNAGTVYYNFYSDITSIKVPYKVQFSYKDRMGEQKYYNKAGYVDPENTSSYTFVEDTTNGEGVESHSVKVTLTDSFILSLAPYESNFTKNLTWDKPTDSMPFDSSVSKSIASAVVKSTQSDRTIHLNIYKDSEGNPTPLINDAGQFKLYEKDGSSELPYGSVFYTEKTDGTYKYDITAKKTYTDKDGKTLQFMYWAIYSDPECKNLVINAYNSEGHFSYVAYDNCWIVPVYGESSTPVASVKDVYTSTQFMEVTRNQWTAKTDSAFAGFDADSMNTLDTNKDFIKGNDEDKLYADFVLNFFYNGKQLSVFDPDSSKVQTGIVMQKLKLENDSIGVGYNTDMKYYANKYINDLPAAAEDAKNKILTGKSSIESLTKQINNDRLDNKNRLQYYARFNNTETNANCVYRVYTYIKYVNESNDTVVELGKPIYFTLYDVANATV